MKCQLDLPDGADVGCIVGCAMTIIKEVVSLRSGNVYVWFKGIDEWEGKETVLNKEAIEKSDSSSTYKIWSTSRNKHKDFNSQEIKCASFE